MKIHYVYLTTNLINGKQYVGDHTISSTGVYYIGSGDAIENAIKKYKRCHFFKEILEWFDTREEAFLAQEKYIKKYNTLTPNGYNISPKGGLRVFGCHSEETKQKIGKANKGRKHSEETKNKWSKQRKGNKLPEKTKDKLKLVMKGKNLGKKLTPFSNEHRKNMGLSRLGKKRGPYKSKNDITS